MKYRKKPVVIEAVQWDGEDWVTIYNFVRASGAARIDLDGVMHIMTAEGEVTASAGDFIIRGIAGEYYPCKPDIFEKTYERVAAKGR